MKRFPGKRMKQKTVKIKYMKIQIEPSSIDIKKLRKEMVKLRYTGNIF